MDEPDPRVLAAARDGDHDALAELVRLAQSDVWRFVRGLVGDAETAADLTQETLLRVVRSIGRFEGRSRFRTWVFAIARNIVRDHHRAAARRPRLVPLDEHRADAADPRGGPVDRAELRAAVLDLPEHLREVFVMVEVLGLRYREVADVIDVAEGTIKSRMFHARRTLVQWFDDTGQDRADG